MSITSSLIVQMIVFLILVWFTRRFVWPPLAKALDERAEKIRQGLAAADNARKEAASAAVILKVQMQEANAEQNRRLADAEAQARRIVEESRVRAQAEYAQIVASGKAQADGLMVQAREVLRKQVALLAVQGAEQILQREVDPKTHADLLKQLQAHI